MRRSITVPLIAIMALWGLVVPADAGSLSGTVDGDSTLTPTSTPGFYIQNFTGDGDDSNYGSFTPFSQSDVDFSKPPNIVFSDGTLTEVFMNGTLFGTTSGTGTANGKGSATFSIDYVITGGTGIFAGAMGEVTLTGTITQTGSTTEAISNGSYTGSFTVVPEPGTLAILAPALALGAVVLVRQKRRRPPDQAA
jgi:hypothetical protein